MEAQLKSGPSPIETKLKKYNSIDLMRLLCAVMVVAIHTQPLVEYQNIAGFFATYIFPRLGVPFFFAVSGFFYTKGLIAGKNAYLKYIKRLLTIYVIWSLIYYLVDFVQILRDHNSITAFIKRSIINFFLYGSHYQLWFFPTLIFCVTVATLLRKQLKALVVVSLLLYAVGCMVGAYYRLGSEIPFINSLFHSNQLEIVRRNLLMGLPFFLLGYLLNLLYPKLIKVKNSTLCYILLGTAALYLVEIFTVRALKLQTNIIMTVFLYPLLAVIMLLCLRFPLQGFDDQAKFCKISANFMYYSHPLYMFVIGKILSRLFHIQLSNTPLFLVICLTTVVSSLIIFKLNNRYLNKLVE